MLNPLNKDSIFSRPLLCTNLPTWILVPQLTAINTATKGAGQEAYYSDLAVTLNPTFSVSYRVGDIPMCLEYKLSPLSEYETYKKKEEDLVTPHLNTCACSQTEGPSCLTTMNPNHCCLSTAHFTYHIENKHSLQLQSYNSCTEQMWHSARTFSPQVFNVFFQTRKSVWLFSIYS